MFFATSSRLEVTSVAIKSVRSFGRCSRVLAAGAAAQLTFNLVSLLMKPSRTFCSACP